MQTISREDLKKKYPDLSKVEGSITEIIQSNFKRIWEIFEDESVSDDEFKELVTMIIESAKDTPARKRILDNLESKRTKLDIGMYVNNIWLKGQNMGVI